jgi:CBS-domain-containing membrane protein
MQDRKRMADGRLMTPDLMAALFDTPYVAYIKQVAVEGKPAYAIFAADGTELGVVQNRDIAFAAARHNDYNPVSVH